MNTVTSSPILKQADDQSRRLALLADLQQSPLLDARQRDWLREELERTKRGMQGEREATFHINSEFRDAEHHVVLHDLRLEVDGEVAQIDHLIISRALRFYLLETKCFSGELRINAQGEFSVRYGQGQEYGIPSPLEQSRRHERVLARLLGKLEITGRLGARPTFHHAVLLHPKAIIQRPNAQEFDSSNVIKADQIGTWRIQYNEKNITGLVLVNALINLHSMDSVRAIADKLLRLHRPVNPLELPAFMKPKAAPPTAPVPAPAQPAVTTPNPALKRKLVCATCGQKISFTEGKFCWNREQRFGGFQYCREHQQPVTGGNG